MAVIDGRVSKKARRSNKICADLYDFYTFPVTEARSKQPFRVGVRDFLSNHARVTFPPSTLFSSLTTWQIFLSAGDTTNNSDLSSRFVTLDVVEEDVTKSSRSVYCDHCRVVGWSGHPVCRKRYHFIIRSRESKGMEMDLQKSCSRCGDTQFLPDGSSCGWCESALGVDDAMNWVYSQLDNQTHLLHGVIHYNGYAHLLSLNGIEGGSGFLTGGAIMDFWDRLCSALAVNKASVMDVSRKYGVDYRLLHAVTKGHSWYGEWGYEFKSGSYALTRDAYQSAVETLSAMPVTEFLYKGRMQRTQLHSVVGFYQSYSCSWSSSDVERVQQAMIKILKAAGGVQGSWITRWALKRSIYKTASPVLLDYCLKHLGGVLADGESQIVNSRWILESRIV